MVVRRFAFAAVVVATICFPRSAPAVQSASDSLFQLEVTDSVGLPLPDAKVEWFTYMPGGVWREWVEVAPFQLEPGMHLLRLSHEGYRPSILSVPLEKGRRASLRVRLRRDTGPDTGRSRVNVIDASDVRGVGLIVGSGVARDFLGERRIIDRPAIERAGRSRLSDILRRVSGAGVMVLPGSAGRSTVRIGGRQLCTAGVMVDGKPNRTITFASFEATQSASDPEVIELVERANAIPFSFRRGESGDCAMVLVWLRGR